MNTWIKNGLGTAAIAAVALGTGWAIRHFHTPGQLDVISAQAMDMSQMGPPSGAAPVALSAARQGSLADTVTYTGTVAAFNEQDISPRITGTLVSLPVYPGDSVQAGQIVARLDTSQVGPQAAQAAAQAREAALGAQVARLTHRLNQPAALAQAAALVQVAQQGVLDAQAKALADQEAIREAQAAVKSASAQTDYWRVEIVREKQLADAGAVSRQEYQSELAQSQAASAALAQAQAKVSQAQAMAAAAAAKVLGARRQVTAAQAGARVAAANVAVAQGQVAQAEAGASAAQAAAQAAAATADYSRLTSPLGGVVTARPVAPGTLVNPGTVVLQVAQIDRVRVQASVAVEDMASIHIGSPVKITGLGGSGKTIAARVSAIFPSASDQTRTTIVEAVIPNPDHRLLPGAFASMQISKDAGTDKLLVPASSVISQGGLSYVWTGAGGTRSAAVYVCEKCGMHYSAAVAKKNNYIDPMDGGKLTPLASPSAAGLTAHRVAVRIGASDGNWTEIDPGALSAGTQVVTHGQAGLTEGVAIIAADWGQSGPKTLPKAAATQSGQTLYRCEKCGMTYSAADAKKNNYIDPMDGGKLVPVTNTQGGR